MNKSVIQIARKELTTFFASPVAFIFLGTFLAVNLFIFFWVETFFARNIADVRPLFERLPMLLIFLVAALTMRMWSEERRMGTLEFLLTLPVNPLRLVIGKFSACMMLVVIALALTLPIPITVSFLGDLDWGPVIGGYVATVFLAAAYTSIGLFVSSKSDSQIVSLIVTVLICFAFYLLGTDSLAGLVGTSGSEFLKLLGTGSRFESITRGVIDVRDLYYYLSIVGVFISLNLLGLERIRWADVKDSKYHSHWRAVTMLCVVNFIAGNIWLQRVHSARVDITQGNIFSISDATRSYLDQLQEPLLIRGYFGAKTHPLLAPLVPQLRDLIIEYGIAGGGNVRTEFIDPRENPELEEEANQKYGIKPVPFQISDKYQASLVNSYFNVLVQYGDKYEVLSFQDLIEVKASSETDLEVQLRNPEYDITRSIKKVMYGFQSTDNLFAGLKNPLKFTGFVSADEKLPDVLKTFKAEVNTVLDDFKKSAGDKLEVMFQDPEAGDGSVAKTIGEEYGFRPMVAGLLDPHKFYFYLTLAGKEQFIQVPLPENLSKDDFKRSMEGALKRFSAGFLKTLGLVTPENTPMNPYMRQMGMDGGKEFRLLQEKLGENYTVKSVDLKSGVVPDDVDLLLVAAPKNLDDKQLFGIDQFLMKGGTIVLGTSPYSVDRSRTSLDASKQESGLKGWLEQYGINIEDKLVLDPQNENYPIPVQRRLGGFQVEELRMVQYPYFVDVRSSGMNQDASLTSGIPQVTLNWVSPINIDAEKNKGRTVTTLLKSSDDSWASDSTQIIPDFNTYGDLGFAPAGPRKSFVLAAAVEGSFSSYFAGKENPMLKAAPEEKKEEDQDPATAAGKDKQKEEKKAEKPVITSIIEKSPDSGRIIVFASNEFLADQTLQISASTGSSRFLNTLGLVENAADWSLEDRGLLSIRSRGHFSRTLEPLPTSSQMFWEYLNYGFALAGLALIYFLYRMIRRNAEEHYRRVLSFQGA